MARINPDLIAALQKRLNVGQARVYDLIKNISGKNRVERHLGALLLASDAGLSFQKYATKEDIADLRGFRDHATVQMPSDVQAPAQRASIKRGKKSAAPKKIKDNSVFVVHGRDEALRKSMFSFLRALGLKPMEWDDALAEAKGANPNVGDIIDTCMNKVQAVVVVFSPDDEAKLKDEFLAKGEKTTEGKLQGQPRANVIFEAGLALGRHAEKTLLVQVGRVRGFTDIAGKHLARLNNDVARRNDVANRLEKIGCLISKRGNDWMTEGDFNR